MGLIQKHVHESRASRISLWGHYHRRLAVILTADDNIMPARFEPYRLTGWSLDHHLDNQLVRLTLEKNGATGWINGDRSTFLSQYSVKHRPDRFISLPDGRLIAVETERRIKTKRAISPSWRATCWLSAIKMAVRVLRRPGRGEKARPEDYFRQHRQRDREKPAACATGGKTPRRFRFYTLDELKTGAGQLCVKPPFWCWPPPSACPRSPPPRPS